MHQINTLQQNGHANMKRVFSPLIKTLIYIFLVHQHVAQLFPPEKKWQLHGDKRDGDRQRDDNPLQNRK